LYKTRSQAESAVDALQKAGFRSDDISILLPDQQSSEEFAHEKNTKAPEGTTTGVAAGGVLGGTLGLLAGIGALAIPDLDLSLRLALLWVLWRGLAQAELSEASSEL
jgi:hypothetical protein